MACGVAAFSAGIFHLMTHAFFKGLLFLAAGSVIHAVGGEQDMRKMGGLRTIIPDVLDHDGATLAIAGIPPFAGFFSKDEILWRAYQANWIYWAGRPLHRVSDIFLHVPAVVHDVLRRISRRLQARTTMHGHDHARRSRRPRSCWHSRELHGHGGSHECPWDHVVPRSDPRAFSRWSADRLAWPESLRQIFSQPVFARLRPRNRQRKPESPAPKEPGSSRNRFRTS